MLTTSSASSTSNFVYDPNGRLFQVTINGATRQFLYDGDALVAEYDTSGNVLKRYVHGDQVDEPWVQYNGSSVTVSNRRYLHRDHQGSIIAHSDYAGNIALQPNGTVAKFAYDGFGIPLANNSDSFGYTGQIYFKELGLNYYKARFYSPKLGRFLQTDPIGYKDDMDLYSYVGNDFINKTDPTGTNWYKEDGKWAYHQGNEKRNGSRGFTHLMVVTKTGTDKNGTAHYNVTLLNQNKIAAKGAAFSGGSDGAKPIDNGNYMIRGDLSKDSSGPASLNSNFEIPNYSGIQKLSHAWLNMPGISARTYVWGDWGQTRAMLNPMDGQKDRGLYYHGQRFDEANHPGQTHGCLSYGSDTSVIDYLWNAPGMQVPVNVN